LPSGKWYAECTIKVATSGTDRIGIISASQANFSTNSNPYVGAFSQGYAYMSDGQKENNATQSSYGATYTTNDIIGIALDMDAGTVTFYKNGSSQGQAYSGLSGAFCFAGSPYNGGTHVWNFGQRPFVYTAPSGFKAVVDTNLSTPTIAKGNTVMDVVTYTGTGGTQSITLPGGFSPDFVWMKARSNAQDHYLLDAIRGGSGILRSNTTGAESTGTPYLSFDSTGFTCLNDLSSSGYTYATWCWDAGTSTVSNTQGSITSQVRANPTAGFSICTFTQPSSSSSFSWGHGLNVAPQLAIMKPRDSSGNWQVYHASTGAQYLWLNSTNAATGTGWSTVNSSIVTATSTLWQGSNVTTVAYCFSPVVGYSSMGSYEGTSGVGAFVYTGMRPRWLLVKKSSNTSLWYIFDSARDSYNAVTKSLYANQSNAEDTSSTPRVDFLSNGFKIVSGANDPNDTGTWIYFAVAEAPFNYSRAR